MLKGWHRCSSDHKPISLQICETEWGPKPFKAFNVWLREDSLRKLIEELPASERNVFSLLRSYKGAIKRWSSEFNQGMIRDIAQLEEKIRKTGTIKVDPEMAARSTSQLRLLYGKQMDYLK